MKQKDISGLKVFSGLIVFLIILILDQVSKHWVLGVLENGRSLSVTDFFSIVLVWNRGVSFGFLGGIDHEQVRWGIVLVSVLIMLLLLYWLVLSKRFLFSIGLGMMLGGAMGNVIDRIVFGAVVDFIHLYWKDFNWYIFNIADVGVTCGVVAIMIDSFIGRDKSPQGQDKIDKELGG